MMSSASFSWTMSDDPLADNHQEGSSPPDKIAGTTSTSSSTRRRRSSRFSCRSTDTSTFRDMSISELFGEGEEGGSSNNFDPFGDSLVSSDEEEEEEVKEKEKEAGPQKTTQYHHRLQHHKDEQLPTSQKVDNECSSPVIIPKEGTETEDHATLLHRTCQQFPTNLGIIQTAIALDADAARHCACIPVLGSTATLAAPILRVPFPNQNQKSLGSASRKEPYHIPINIALHNHASLEVVQTLIEAAPEMLQKPDGGSRAGLTTLLLALQREPNNVALVKLILKLQPQAVAVMDTKHNTPLHVACKCACPLETIRLLYHANPAALTAKNFHGETPKHVAERTCNCSEDAIDFFQRIRSQQAPQELNLL